LTTLRRTPEACPLFHFEDFGVVAEPSHLPERSTRVVPSPNRVCETQLHRLRPSEDPAIGILVENLRFHVAAFDDGGFELGQDIVQQVLEKGPLFAG
jgi:hypothetical protein